MEEIITSTPGFAKDENGRFHFQGAHSQSEYVIDGQTISDQTGVTFSNSIDPGIAQSIEVIYGNVPAEYGEKIGAVINLVTKSGLGIAGFKGDVYGGDARFDTYEGGLPLGRRHRRRSAFFGSVGGVRARTASPTRSTPDNLNNHGDTQRAFLRFDLASPDSRNAFRLTALLGRTDRDVTEHVHSGGRGQDQTVKTEDQNYNLGWQHIVSRVGRPRRHGVRPPREVHAVSVRRRHAGHGRLGPVARQLRHHAVASRGRRRSTSSRWAPSTSAYPDRGALSASASRIPAFNDPASPDYNPNLAPYDLTRGGTSLRLPRHANRHLLRRRTSRTTSA